MRLRTVQIYQNNNFHYFFQVLNRYVFLSLLSVDVDHHSITVYLVKSIVEMKRNVIHQLLNHFHIIQHYHIADSSIFHRMNVDDKNMIVEPFLSIVDQDHEYNSNTVSILLISNQRQKIEKQNEITTREVVNVIDEQALPLFFYIAYFNNPIL